LKKISRSCLPNGRQAELWGAGRFNSTNISALTELEKINPGGWNIKMDKTNREKFAEFVREVTFFVGIFLKRIFFS